MEEGCGGCDRGDETCRPAAAAQAARSRRASRASPGRGGGSLRPATGLCDPSGSLAVDRRPSRKRGRLKGQSTGGRAEQASNIARGTPENWRTCGYDNPDGASSKSVVPPASRERCRSAGQLMTRRPARPFNSGRTAVQTSGAKRAARTRAVASFLPLSRLRERVAAQRRGEGTLKQEPALSKLTLRVRHPLPQAGEGTEAQSSLSSA
jgi:hypothetical protein